MKSRSVRLLAAVIAAFSLLFAQLAVAAYACPVQAPQKMAAHAMPVHGGAHPYPSGHCKSMEKQQPSLCHAHCHPSDSSADHTPLPPVAPFAATSAFVIVPPVEAHALAQLDVFVAPVLSRATEPPSAIRHCCFRI